MKNRAPSCPPVPIPNLPALGPIQLKKFKKAKPIKKAKSCSDKLIPKRVKKVLPPPPPPIIEKKAHKKAACKNDKKKKKIKKVKQCKVVIAAN